MTQTIAEALAAAQTSLDALDARVLLRHVLAADDAALLAHPERVLDPGEEQRFATLAARRAAGEPIVYLTGVREFFGLEFRVTPAVLIPRPETELLVEFALERIPRDRPCRVLDLGTGSGCIGISIARERPLAHVVATDYSAEALAIARENAARILGGCPKAPSSREGVGNLGAVEFVESDWFSALGGKQFDVLVSNPPYVAADDPHLAQGDLRYEPRAALTAGSDGLDCIRLIVATAPQYLAGGGVLAFEHGYNQAARCRELLVQSGFGNVGSHRDLAGIERVTSGARP